MNNSHRIKDLRAKYKSSGSYFGSCERDAEGHCLPSGESGAKGPETNPADAAEPARPARSSGPKIETTELRFPNSESRELVKQTIIDVAAAAKVNLERSAGFCAEMSVAVWDKLSRPANLVPYSVMNGEEEHVILFDKKTGVVVDPTGSQYDNPVFSSKEKSPYKKYVKLKPDEIQGARDEMTRRLNQRA